MGTILKTSTLTAAAFIGLLVGVSNAQDILNARVPFSFVVGSEQFLRPLRIQDHQAVLTDPWTDKRQRHVCDYPAG